MMLFVDNENITKDDFIFLLEETRNRIVSDFSKQKPKEINGNIFEAIVYEQMVLSSKNTQFEGFIKQTGTNSFPDIIAKKLYGVEVKMTISDKWVSIGNSVLEKTRVEDIETIYLFFGKFGNQFDIKFRKYQECLYEVGVTHSPRYKIDMNLGEGGSIFNKIGVDYDVFRKEENPIKILKDHYRKQLRPGEDLWWIDGESEEKVVNPIIQTYSLLDKPDKEQFIIDCFILFPEIFSKSTSKFERAAAYLITEYNTVCSSMRDNFTSGGKVEVVINGKTEKISRVAYNLFTKAKEINNRFRSINIEKLSYYWGCKVEENPIEIWKKLISKQGNNSANITSIYDEGLKL